MQNKEYIVNRMLPGMVAAACELRSITFQAYSDDWVLRLNQNGRTKWIFGYKFDLNSAASASIAQDKVATYQSLEAAGITAVPHYLARTLSSQIPADIHEALGTNPVVSKPLSGTGGRDVQLHKTYELAAAAVKQMRDWSWTFSPYINLVAEFRVVILDGEIVLSYKKTQPFTRGGLRYFNLGLGATAEHIITDDLTPPVRELALQATSALCLRLAAVDIVLTADNTYMVIEVNDGICMEHYALQGDDYKLRTANMYDVLVERMFTPG